MKSKRKKIKFVITSVQDLTGGAIVRFRLCKILNDLGYDARIFDDNYLPYQSFFREVNNTNRIKSSRFYCFLRNLYFLRFVKVFCCGQIKYLIVKFFPDYVKNRTEYSTYFLKTQKKFGYKRKYLPFVSKNTVVIYPETIYGNPLKAKKVVRWFLYYYLLADVPNSYKKEDLFFTYREQFNNKTVNPECKILHTSFFDLDLYKRTNFGERNGKCYILRKAIYRMYRQDLPKTFDGIIIDDLPEKEKVKVFNECEYCISYDTQTAYSAIASLCGCKSIIVPEPGKTRADYRTPEDKELGISWSFDEAEIKKAQDEAEQLYDYYSSLNNTGVESVKQFVRICEDKWLDD